MKYDTISFGKIEGNASDKNIAFMLQDDEVDGPHYRQVLEGVKPTTLIISAAYDFYMPPAFFPWYDGSAVNVEDMWHFKGNVGLVVGTNIKPRSDLQPRPAGDACYVFRQGDSIKNFAPQGNQSVASPQIDCAPGIHTIAMSFG